MESSHTATTTQSPGSTLRRLPPPSPMLLESSSPVDAIGPTTVAVPTPETPLPSLALLGGDLQFIRGVQDGLPPTTENLLSFVPEEGLLSADIEMQCWGLVMTRLVADT